MPSNRWGKAAYAGIFLLLAATAVQSVRLGMAGLFVQRAQSEIQRWSAESRSPRRYEIRNAANYFLSGLGFAPGNPWALEGLGMLELARMRISTDPREALAVTRAARVRIRQALQLRPTSPFLWANLALTKLYLDEVDEELFTALRNADELGPWEPAAQETVLFVGLAAWENLNAGVRQALTHAIERGGVHNASKMLEIVKSYTRPELVCAIEKYRIIAGQFCAKDAQTPGATSR
jgi:hypothetical protein